MPNMVDVSVNLDKDVYEKMKRICDDIGISVEVAFTIFATKVSREYRIPFELSADPFYE